eukprot:GHVU01052325.1.p1 GENE.GHVU01052325.1~~GHVU01052325.1.p1  ORF type:complete len:129 (+),score=10.08 GHVU01052325.1:360-746(+)
MTSTDAPHHATLSSPPPSSGPRPQSEYCQRSIGGRGEATPAGIGSGARRPFVLIIVAALIVGRELGSGSANVQHSSRELLNSSSRPSPSFYCSGSVGPPSSSSARRVSEWELARRTRCRGSLLLQFDS